MYLSFKKNHFWKMGENFEKRDLLYEIQHAIFIVMIPGFSS